MDQNNTVVCSIFHLISGVTTVVDGGSAGAMTLAGLRHFIAERSATRVLAFVHVACHGLSGAACAGAKDAGGESDHLNAIKVRLKNQNDSIFNRN